MVLRAQTPLIGRAAELSVLRAALRAATDGRAGAVLVTGEAGVGKTRLVGALLDGDVAADAVVLRAQCVDLGDPGLPFLAVGDLVRALHESAPEALDEAPLLARLQSPGGVDGHVDEAARLQLLEATASALLRAATARGPLLAVIEDVQWADTSSGDFLRFLLSRLRDEPLLVIATVRTDGLAGRPVARRLLGELTRLPAVVRIDLAPFDEAEVGDYLAALTAAPVPPEAVTRIRRRTGGNPFYVQALAGNWAEDDAVPAALTDILLGRVEALSPESRGVVRTVAVAMRPVPHEVLRRAAGLTPDALDRAVREAIAERLLVPADGRYRFAHDLVRQAVADDLLPADRMRRHAALARALVEELPAASAAEIAYHCCRTDDRPSALLWSLRAAADATRLLAPAETLDHLTRALESWDAVDAAARPSGWSAAAVATAAAHAAGLVGEHHRAVELARRAIDLAADATEVARARIELARQLVALDRADEAVPHARAAADAASGALGVEAAGVLARALLIARQPADALRQCRDRAERALPLAAGLPAVEVDLLTTLAFLDEIDGDRTAAAGRLEDAIRLARQHGELAAELRAWYTLACLRYYNGDVAGALPVLDAALSRVTDTGLRWSNPGVELRVLCAVARYVSGDFAAALAAAGVPGARPPDVAAARLAAVGCYPSVALGDATVSDRFEALRGEWEADAQIALVAGGCEADHLNWRGDHRGAVAVAQRAQEHLDRAAGPGMYGGLWLSALALGALADDAAAARRRRDAETAGAAQSAADELLDRMHEIAAGGYGRPGDLGPEGQAWVTRAEAEYERVHGRPAIESWRRAVDAFGFGYRYEQARCRWRLAEALLEAGDRGAAAEQARAAAAAAAELGAAPLRAAVAALIARGRLDGRAAAGPLTERELEVLALVAEGLTNRQIGQRLFISEKTASVHLSNLMAKLDVSGRTEAVTVAQRRGLLDIGAHQAQ